jgi:hypothetical protein
VAASSKAPLAEPIAIPATSPGLKPRETELLSDDDVGSGIVAVVEGSVSVFVD